MQFIRFLFSAPIESIARVALMTCLAAASGIFLIAIVNGSAEQVALGGEVPLRTIVLFVSALSIYYLALQASLTDASQVMQVQLGKLTQDTAEKIAASDLRTIEELGLIKIYNTISHEANHLSQNFPLIVSAAQGIIILLFSLVYVAVLSVVAFWLITGATAAALLIFVLLRRYLNRELMGVHDFENKLLGRVSDYLDGFSEIRLNADKNDALQADFEQVTRDLKDKVTGIGRRWARLIQFSDAYLYLLLGGVVFLVPLFSVGGNAVVYKLSVLAVFCVAPVTALTSVAPMYERASVGLQHILALNAKLSTLSAVNQDSQASDYSEFQSIGMANVTFNYGSDADRGFGVGPLSLIIERGETLFVTGVNGSGKSTMIKLLCGLYTPASGEVLVSGEPVTERDRQAYRDLFAAVFSDFHLFHRPYGYGDADPAHVADLIDYLGLDNKVTFKDGRFSTQALSTGQRKRLGLVIALLENKPIILLDEWAADQDSGFRTFFYMNILPWLKARGKTVIAVTHDDRYWDQADRKVTVDFGMIVEAPGRDAPSGGGAWS